MVEVKEIGQRILLLQNRILIMAKSNTSIHLPILIEQDEDGMFIISCPTFKGCHSYGKTIEEGIENIKEVIELCLQEEQQENLNRFVGFRELEVSTKVA
jgi:predicted RNase H-like HicB family nuclease